VGYLLDIKDAWEGHFIEESLRVSCGDRAVNKYKIFPLLIALRVWLERNASLFEDRFLPTVQCVSQVISIKR
jgi:hypothetical protein